MRRALLALILLVMCASCSIVLDRAPMMPQHVRFALLQPVDLDGKLLSYAWVEEHGCEVGGVLANATDGDTTAKHTLWLCPDVQTAQSVYALLTGPPLGNDVRTPIGMASAPLKADQYDAWCDAHEYFFGNTNMSCVVMARYGRVVSRMSVLGVAGQPYTPTGDDLVRFTLARDGAFVKLAGR